MGGLKDRIYNFITAAFVTVSDDDMKIFVGKNWPDYERHYRALRYGEENRFRWKDLNGLAFTFVPVWLLYRRFYLTGILYLAASTGLDFGLSHYGREFPLTDIIGLVVASQARTIYLLYAASRIRALREHFPSDDRYHDQLLIAGGVAPGAAYVGFFFALLVPVLRIYQQYETLAQQINSFMPPF